MKEGDFVCVHFCDETGDKIGRFVSCEDETVSVLLGTVTGENIVLTGIPKQQVELWLAT